MERAGFPRIAIFITERGRVNSALELATHLSAQGMQCQSTINELRTERGKKFYSRVFVRLCCSRPSGLSALGKPSYELSCGLKLFLLVSLLIGW